MDPQCLIVEDYNRKNADVGGNCFLQKVEGNGADQQHLILYTPLSCHVYIQLDSFFHQTLFCRVSFPLYHGYLNKAVDRRKEWALCYRTDLRTRGNNTDNYTESIIFVFKCVVLRRMRAYNLIELFHFITEDLEMYFSGKLRHGPQFFTQKSEGGGLSLNAFALES